MGWTGRSAENLLPLSEEQVDLKEALREWIYSGDMYDPGEAVETCELCGHPDIRYQFKIVNTLNSNELLIGSECVNKFGIGALDDQGRVLGRDESRRKVNSDRRFLVGEARKKRLIATLVELSAKESNFEIDSFINYVQDRGAFTPKQLSLLFWRLDEYSIQYNPLDFKLTIKRKKEKEQLLEMPDWKIKKMWGAMSPSQKQWYGEEIKNI